MKMLVLLLILVQAILFSSCRTYDKITLKPSDLEYKRNQNQVEINKGAQLELGNVKIIAKDLDIEGDSLIITDIKIVSELPEMPDNLKKKSREIKYTRIHLAAEEKVVSNMPKKITIPKNSVKDIEVYKKSKLSRIGIIIISIVGLSIIGLIGLIAISLKDFGSSFGGNIKVM